MTPIAAGLSKLSETSAAYALEEFSRRDSSDVLHEDSESRAEAREASNAALQSTRDEIVQAIGLTDLKVELWEGVYTNIKVPATA